ncbi:DUF2795 domain-containing protein [Polyangium jinanense]|uniref:DUF2795 domain-containing protein n=1 Tax=Polyangium jinanense TaxID=2829994 RepID=A0A9X3X643_9BACT|nr:DUF2795 domain-containing protein [Polyangium jinanense]MDC3956142.1 DUF2795 domain-containing protein [Polyangium jinanense]MDC3983023.1 DUF2795 domain-containing protein [Polyangium jinanense]
MAEKNKDEGKGTMTVQEAGHLGGKEVQHQRDLRDRKEVRGQAYDKPGPPEGTAFGIGAITQALAGMEFPVTKQDLLERAGDQEIEYRKGQPVSLRQIIEDLEDEEFPSMANVVQAVSGALKEEGLSGGGEKEEKAA